MVNKKRSTKQEANFIPSNKSKNKLASLEKRVGEILFNFIDESRLQIAVSDLMNELKFLLTDNDDKGATVMTEAASATPTRPKSI